MQRRPLLETMLHEVHSSFGTLVAFALGAVALYYAYQRRRRITRPPAPFGSGSGSQGAAATASSSSSSSSSSRDGSELLGESTLQALRRGAFARRVVCVEWSVLHDGARWVDANAAPRLVAFLARNTDVHFICRISSDADKRTILQCLRGIAGVQRHKILFHTTSQGFVALSRQLSPALLVTDNSKQVEFLSSVLLALVYVGAGAYARRNVKCVASIGELVAQVAPTHGD